MVAMAEVVKKKKKIGKVEGHRSLRVVGQADEYEYEPKYEEIEAPKFVDFVAPDSYNPDDDRYWFCSRVGCDQKHEEEIDSEMIWKNFVLKVMAARSPNVRLRKALSRKPPNATAKCPQSAPEKPSRLRTSRLAVLSSSVSRKLAFAKGGMEESSHREPKTPSNKKKRNATASQALTTPRNRACVSNQHLFNSVRNSKVKINPVKSKKVATKALAFPSPRKIKRTTATPELKNSIRDICEGMKKLELGTPRKNILGYEKSSPSACSMKRPSGRVVKSRAYDSFRLQSPKGNANTEYSEGLKRRQMIRNELKERPDLGESSHMEVDGKSSRGSVEAFNGAIAEQTDPTNPKTSELSQNPVETSRNPTKIDSEENRKDEAPPSCLLEKGEGKDNEAFDSDDKENVVAPDRNREQKDVRNSNSIKKPDVHQKTQKVSQSRLMTLKENAAVEKEKADLMKQTKPKPTNPKPFRLRTNERGILKEANLEKKLQIEPKETEGMSNNNSSANLPKSRMIASKVWAQGNYNEKKFVRMPNNHAMAKNTSSRRYENEVKKLPHQKDKSCSREGPVKKKHRKPVISLQLRGSKDNVKRNKSVTVKQLERPRRTLVTKPGATKGSLVEDNGKKESEDTGEGCCTSSATKADTPGGEPRSLSRVRKTPTIPKEPHFHEIHVPKSCTRKVK